MAEGHARASTAESDIMMSGQHVTKVGLFFFHNYESRHACVQSRTVCSSPAPCENQMGQISQVGRAVREE